MSKTPSEEHPYSDLIKDLNDRQVAFCEEYIVDLNGTQAAIRAGYAERTARTTAAKLLAKGNIQAYVDALKKARSVRTEITADNVLNELAKLAFSDIRKMFTPAGHILPVVDVDDLTASSIQSVEVVTRPTGMQDEDGNPEVEYVHKFRMADKNKSLELLGKHLKLFTDRVELGGRVMVKDLRGVNRG